MKRKSVVMVMVLLAMCWMSDTLQAQPGPPDASPPDGMPMPQMKDLENLRLLKLLDVLDLTEEQSPAFIAAFSQFRKDGNELREAVDAEVDTLTEMLKAEPPDEIKIGERVRSIDRLRVRREQSVEAFHKEAAEILTPVQLGRMVAFELRFDRELIERIRGFRGGRRGSKSPGTDDF
ncbi:MAG: periplasmic heavy metal sensor [candidate division Zixibacteria bacterium]|nr:periplasmic heavy metal sensor [candidate division Zixibacteria bacterium]